ncbi:MAG: M12 family metallo-peptidase [Dehalococcoidia bacterium]
MRRTVIVVFVLASAWLTAFTITSFATAPGATGRDRETADECGRIIVSPHEGPAFHSSSTRVLLALDEEWRDLLGARARESARSLLADVSALFRNTHIHLLPVELAEWESPGSTDQARDLLAFVEANVERGDADIVIALTGQALAGEDGLARRNGRYVVVEHHPGRLDKDALVLAHEVAHLFGAGHSCDLPGGNGLMSEDGFRGPTGVCPCTERVLEANAARFHDLLSGAAEPSE